MMTDDPAWPLAQHVCRSGYADLPASAVESARRDMLDTFGCMLGGSGSPGIDELFAVISRWGGLPECRVLLRGTRLPAPQAGLLNASMGHALDFDDTLDTGGSIHPGVAVLGSVLAVCDSLEGVTGRDVLLAVALGLDVSCRIALASTLDRGWHRTAAIGVFGATAAAGKLIGLTPEQMLAAFGIAYSHAAGNRQCILDGALTKRMQAGQAASAGVFAAVLARTGFTGAQNIFNGRFGFFELYQPNGYDASVLLHDLGMAFRGEELSYKPYPCGRPLHAAIDAALAARARLDIKRPDDIEAVTIEAEPRRSQRPIRPRAREAPPHPGGRSPVCPALSGSHRSGAWQGGYSGGGRSRGCRGSGAVGSDNRHCAGWQTEGLAQHHGTKNRRALSCDRGDRSDRVTTEAADECPARSKVPRLRARHARQPLSDASIDAVLATIRRLETLPDARVLITPFAG
jgi:hypothetical protein